MSNIITVNFSIFVDFECPGASERSGVLCLPGNVTVNFSVFRGFERSGACGRSRVVQLTHSGQAPAHQPEPSGDNTARGKKPPV